MERKNKAATKLGAMVKGKQESDKFKIKMAKAKRLARWLKSRGTRLVFLKKKRAAIVI